MELSEEQTQALELFKEGKNIFLTGPGGSGKSVLIRKFVEEAKLRNKEVQICALTGCATVLLGCEGAKTIHSWAGIGIATGPFGTVVDRVTSSKHRKVPWKKVDILIIDEVSMMSVKVFDILDTIGKKVKNRYDKPFGGIQIVFSGDFYQLPPVGDLEDENTSAFCFESERWNESFNHTILLTTIFRQTDKNYVKILNNIRVGKITPKSFARLQARVDVSVPEDSIIKPTILLPRRIDADIINKIEFDKLEGESITFSLKETNNLTTTKEKTNSSYRVTPQHLETEMRYLKNNIRADAKLELKIGTQVMCIANIEMEGPYPIVNGSQGIVVAFSAGLPLVQFNDGQKRIIGEHTWPSETLPGIGVKQLPLIYAWAITIHKSQGVTLECAQIDAGSQIFECGQTYVALSRVKDLNGLYLTGFNPQKIKVNRKVQTFYNNLFV